MRITIFSSITPNFPAGQETSQTVHVGKPGDAFYAKWDFVKSITENIHTVCMKMDSTLNEIYGQAVKDDGEWMDVMGDFIGTLNKDKINSQAVDYSFSCVAPACDPGLRQILHQLCTREMVTLCPTFDTKIIALYSGNRHYSK